MNLLLLLVSIYSFNPATNWLPCVSDSLIQGSSIQNPESLLEKESIVQHEDTVKGSRFRYDYFQEFVAGYAFGGLAYYFGAILSYDLSNSPDTVPVSVKAIGFSLCGLAASAGVYWIGNKYFKGNLLGTLAGCILLPATIGVINKYTAKSDAAEDIMLVSIPLGAFLGYNIFKKKQ